MVAEDSTLLEVEQADLSLIENTRIAVGRVFRQDLDVSIPQTADAELIKMIVPPVECGLNSEMQMLQVPMDRQEQTAPDVRLDAVDGNSDRHGVRGFEYCPNELGWWRVVKAVACCAWQIFSNAWLHLARAQTINRELVAVRIPRVGRKRVRCPGTGSHRAFVWRSERKSCTVECPNSIMA